MANFARSLLTRLAGLLLAAFPFSLAAEVTVPDPDALDAILNRQVEEGRYPFVYARLEDKHGNVLYEHGAVNDELLPGTTIDGDTWIRVWSMSKIITISVVLDLVEDGALSLDDPVTKYIPEFNALQVALTKDGRNLSEVDRTEGPSACPFQLAPVETAMTVLHLINHQAGFYYATTNIPCIDEPLAKLDVATAADGAEFIERLAQLPLVQQPGASYYYGTNTSVLGLLAERASGQSLAQLVRERLAEPLGIQGLQYSLPEGAELLPRVSGQDGVLRLAHPGELDIFGPSVPDYEPAHELYLGGEGMLATSDGYADFLRMLLARGTLNGHRFLNTETVEDMHSPHTQKDSPYGHNGYNLWVTGKMMRENEQGEEGLWTGGGYEGTHFWIDPKREFVALVMSQIFSVPQGGGSVSDEFRGALYKQFWATKPSDDGTARKPRPNPATPRVAHHLRGTASP